MNQSFWDVIIEGGNASTLSNNDTSRTMTVRNNLTQTGGTFYLKNGGTPGGVHTLEILGNYLHTGGLLGWNSMDFQNSSRTNLIIGGNYSLLSSANWTGYVSLTDCQSGIFLTELVNKHLLLYFLMHLVQLETDFILNKITLEYMKFMLVQLNNLQLVELVRLLRLLVFYLGPQQVIY